MDYEIIEIVQSTPTALHFDHYANIVLEGADNRELFGIALEVATAASRGSVSIEKRESLATSLASIGRRRANKPKPRSVRKLIADCPSMRAPVIHGLLRQGETMNLISAPKVGKSWLVTALAIAVASGRPWLGGFETEQGKVLIIDNELHGETIANRIPKVADGLAVRLEEFDEDVLIEDLRGRLCDLYSLGAYFEQFDPGSYRLVIIDAMYRALPSGTDENDNAEMANVYNVLDRYAARLGCSFVLVHHFPKGNQSSKTVTDVGAGAGSQARATDTHLIMRPHEVDDAYVLEAAVRSWPPVAPRVLRWEFPVWTPDDTLDPRALRRDRPRKTKSPNAVGSAERDTWSPDSFVARFLSVSPATKASIVESARGAGLTERRALHLIRSAEDQGKAFRWQYGSNVAVRFATVPQTDLLD
jgi:hypothetical protein